MVSEKLDLVLKVDASVITELEDAFAKRFGRSEQVISQDPKWKATEKQPRRPMVDNPVSKKEYLLEQLKVYLRRILADDRAEKDNEVKRLKRKEVHDLI